jgi:hypothetical protein
VSETQWVKVQKMVAWSPLCLSLALFLFVLTWVFSIALVSMSSIVFSIVSLSWVPLLPLACCCPSCCFCLKLFLDTAVVLFSLSLCF